MLCKARLHLIALANIDKLASWQIGVRPGQKIDAGARRLLATDQLRQGGARGEGCANRGYAKLRSNDARRRSINQIKF